MFIELSKGDFVAVGTIARITYWETEPLPIKITAKFDNYTEVTEPDAFKCGYRVETKRGEKHNVTDPALMQTLKQILNHI